MQATERQSLVIGKFAVENFMRVRAFAVDAGGRHVVLSGPNGSGKSSVLDALWLTLRSKAKQIAEPVHHGAQEAHTRLELLDDETRTVRYVVERFWSAQETRLVIHAGDGSKVRRAQELLDGLLDAYSLDLSQFLGARPKDQVTAVLKVCGITPPVEEVAEIAGEPMEPRPGEDAFDYLDRLSADGSGVFYDRRRQLSVTLKQKQAALAEAQKAIPAASHANGDDGGETAEELLGKIDELSKANGVRIEAQATAVGMRHRLKGGQGKRAEIMAEIERRKGMVAARRRELEHEIAEQEKAEATYRQIDKDLETFLPRVEEAERQANALQDSTPQINQLREQLRHVEEHRKAAAGREAAVASLQKLDQEVQDLRGQHAKADLIVSRLRELPKAILERIDLGIGGLSVDSGELRLHGVPLAQASQAEKIRVACALAFRRDPSLKVARLDDAEHLDGDSWRTLVAEANRRGWRLMAGFVRDGQELGVELIESGVR